MPGMSQPQRVLVTGSAGRVGRAAVRGLVAAGHAVTGFDRAPSPAQPVAVTRGEISDAAAVRAAVAGAECVVHLAAAPDDVFTPDGGDNFLSELVPANLVGVYQVLEACRREGVRRLILASTGQVIDGHRQEQNLPVTVTAPFRPRYLYACTKVFAEMAGRVYSERHGLQVLAARLGWCPRDPGQVAEIAASPLFQNVFFSPGDVGRFFAAAVGAVNLPGYSVVYAASRPVDRLVFDLEPAKVLLGFEPHDQWPTGADDFT
jgi:nucleoside-diphosphate-sugar epimerase